MTHRIQSHIGLGWRHYGPTVERISSVPRSNGSALDRAEARHPRTTRGTQRAVRAESAQAWAQAEGQAGRQTALAERQGVAVRGRTGNVGRHPRARRARLIARTETSKATTALTQARAEELDLQWYLWRTSEDQRVRVSHRRMNNVIFNWKSPPAPEKLVGEKSTAGRYHAGNIWNCRCYPEPLLRFDQVPWPHKVFVGGAIRPMTLVAFRNLNKHDLAIAA